MTMDVDVTRFRVAGKLGDDSQLPELAGAELGTEVTLVLRATLSSLRDRLDDGAVVCDAQLQVTACAVLETVPAKLRTALDRAAELRGQLPV